MNLKNYTRDLAILAEQHLTNRGFHCTARIETDVILFTPKDSSKFTEIKKELANLGIHSFRFMADLKVQIQGVNAKINLEHLSEKVTGITKKDTIDPLKIAMKKVAEWITDRLREKGLMYGPAVGEELIKLTSNDEAQEMLEYVNSEKAEELIEMGVALGRHGHGIFVIKAPSVHFVASEPLAPTRTQQLDEKVSTVQPKTEEKTKTEETKRKDQTSGEAVQIRTEAIAELKKCIMEMRRVGIGIKVAVCPKNSLEGLSAYYYLKSKDDSSKLTAILDDEKISYDFVKDNKCVVKFHHSHLKRVHGKLEGLPTAEKLTKPVGKRKYERKKKGETPIAPVVTPPPPPPTQTVSPPNPPLTLDNMIDFMGEGAVMLKLIDRGLPFEKILELFFERNKKKDENEIAEVIDVMYGVLAEKKLDIVDRNDFAVLESNTLNLKKVSTEKLIELSNAVVQKIIKK